MGFLSDALDFVHGGGEGKAAEAQMKSAKKAMTYSQPYYTGGQEAYGNYQNFLKPMQNPTQYYDDIMDDYAPSRTYQNRLKRGMETINNGAAQNGTLGMGANQEELMAFLSGEMDEDEQNYFNNVMGIGNNYLGGEQYLSGLGYEAGQDLSSLEGAYGQAKGNKARASSNAFSNYLATGINMGANAMTGGMSGVIQPYTSDYRLQQDWAKGRGSQ